MAYELIITILETEIKKEVSMKLAGLKEIDGEFYFGKYNDQEQSRPSFKLSDEIDQLIKVHKEAIDDLIK